MSLKSRKCYLNRYLLTLKKLSFRVNEEKTRKERLEQVAKEYEELAEREKRILDQINFSLQLSPKPSESR